MNTKLSREGHSDKLKKSHQKIHFSLLTTNRTLGLSHECAPKEPDMKNFTSNFQREAEQPKTHVGLTLRHPSLPLDKQPKHFK